MLRKCIETISIISGSIMLALNVISTIKYLGAIGTIHQSQCLNPMRIKGSSGLGSCRRMGLDCSRLCQTLLKLGMLKLSRSKNATKRRVGAIDVVALNI
jgi:hypothetical protein